MTECVGANPSETAQAIQQINTAFAGLVSQIGKLERTLELTERRALEWEQMHLDELTQRQALQTRVEGLQIALREQIEHNRKRQDVVVADRMEKVSKELASEDWARRKEWDAEESKKRDFHNETVRENVEKQSKIMSANYQLYLLAAERADEQLDLIRRSVIASENQTRLMESISESLIKLSTHRDLR